MQKAHKLKYVCKRTNLFSCLCLSSQVVSNVICGRDLSKAEHVAITLLIIAVCTAMSLAFDCLGVVLELNVSSVNSTSLLLSISNIRYFFFLP